MNWYRRLENKLEPIVTIIGLPIMIAYVLFEWARFEIEEKMREKVARLRKSVYNKK